MSITSFSYLLMVFLGGVLYYILPKSWQWIELLIMSFIFYFMAAEPYTVIYLLVSTMAAYVATNYAASARAKEQKGRKIAIVLGIIAVFINLLLWFVLKGTDIWVSLSYRLGIFKPLPDGNNLMPYVASLGMGYYTLQVIGYILDCYWENVKPQKNPCKLFLFVCFFPQMTTGPISRYHQLETLYEKHRFSYRNVSFGAQRILWGFFKKLVLAERAGLIVNGIWGNLNEFTGFWRWVALLLFPVQMYADFSGCMDIVIGTAEIFGIKLPENFNSPFFSRTAQEFWQRWHITLGTWAKDYVLYPLLKCKIMVRFSKFTKKKFGKRIGKFLATAVGMFVLWMVMGLWHGAFKYVIGVSLWYWVLLMLGELCAPLFRKANSFFRIPEDTFSWHLVQSIRTYLIYAVGATFFRAPSIGEGVAFIVGLKEIFQEETCNPWIFFNGSVKEFGITHQDINVMIVAVLILLIVAILRERYGFAREWMAKQLFVFRWFIWLGLFALVLILGKYGPAYNAAEFIYQRF
ncbi:MAG: hypothetical protein K2P65_06505 [Lachnospiraceae bacterium]|nr:hypothetical protein [Lachnospiraceae bacterium]